MAETARDYERLPKYKLLQFIDGLLTDKTPLKELKKATKREILNFILGKYSNEFYAIPLEVFDRFENPRVFNFEKKVGLKKLTKQELEDYKFNQENYDDPYTGKKPIINPDNRKIELIRLQEHQKKFLNGFLIGNMRSSIVFHGVGTGKTLTAVASANMYLQLYPNNKVFVITPPAVLYNFIESLIAFGIDPRDPRYKFMTYDKFYQSKSQKAENALLIIDEAHNFRTKMEIAYEKTPSGETIATPRFNKKGFSILERGGKPAHKVLLLTATPFVNKTYDIENLLAIGEGRDPNSEETFGQIASDDKMRYDYFKYRISHYERDIEGAMFPRRIETFVPLVVRGEDEKLLKAIVDETNPFYIKTRKDSIKLDNMKVKYVIDEIRKDKKKYIIYTTFEQGGYVLLEKQLKKYNIDYGIISGKVSTGNKKQAIDDFNGYDDPNYKFKNLGKRVLIITRAGAEGVSLKRTKTIFIMDGQWNEALYEQIVARAIRYKSHTDLPKEEQKVFVKKLFLCYESEAEALERINSGEKFDYMSMMISILQTRVKLKQAEKFRGEDVLGKVERGEKKIGVNKNVIDEFLNKIATFGDLEFSAEKLATLKKGSKEKAEYLSKNQAFAKNKETYLTQEVNTLLDKIPSTDFYMFILQKNKKMIVDAFIRQIDRIPQTEQSIMDLDVGSKLFKQIVDGKMTGEQMMKFLIDEMRPNMNKTVNLITNVNDGREERLQKFLQSRKQLSELQLNKLLVKIGQEYFTPLKEAEELFKLSGLEFEFSKYPVLNILEPSAGTGGLLVPIIDFYNKKVTKQMFKFDLVEFSEDNRKVLQDLQDKVPDVFSLQKTRDFLEFTPNKDYNFIFMNPPFHLDKHYNKKYKKDYYDYDFVKRAYAMLDLNGVLVAITGLKYLENPEMVKWYKEKGAKIKRVKGEWKGENLKVGAEIKNLDRVHIYIRKVNDDIKETQELLKIDDFNDNKTEAIGSIEDLEKVVEKKMEYDISNPKTFLKKVKGLAEEKKKDEIKPEVIKGFTLPSVDDEEYRVLKNSIDDMKGGSPLDRSMLKIYTIRMGDNINKPTIIPDTEITTPRLRELLVFLKKNIEKVKKAVATDKIRKSLVEQSRKMPVY